jgi:hypothetical protein
MTDEPEAGRRGAKAKGKIQITFYIYPQANVGLIWKASLHGH